MRPWKTTSSFKAIAVVGSEGFGQLQKKGTVGLRIPSFGNVVIEDGRGNRRNTALSTGERLAKRSSAEE